MKSSTQLQSAVFQLTPTRTRYDLFIIANEKKEKIASGLLLPFIAHLKTAEDQIAKGGYSVLLEPEAGTYATWFTKGTVERFVRFVSTPEILERVYTTESAILQIDEAIAIQGNNNIGLSTIEDHPAKPVVSNEGNKPIPDANEEKAIVLFKPGGHPAEANGSIAQERNSKIELLKVLETRRTMLQKEQGMAFARAAAAGFDMDHMALLVSFAECFGASRLMDACLRFIDLWTRKHESGQWLEVDEAEAISSKSNFSTMDASGIMLPTVFNNQNELHTDLAPENNGVAGANTSVDERSPASHQIPVGQQEYFPGQFPHPMFPPWPIHSPPGALPVFQAYPMQGMPYYQNYSGNSPYYQPPIPPPEDSQFNAGYRTGQKRQSMDSRDSNTQSEKWDMDESSQSQEPHKKGERSGKKQSGMVVIRNINYITSKQQSSSASESESASDSETDTPPKILKSSKRKGSQEKAADETNSYGKEEIINGKETDGGHWQAFQSCLLRATDKNNRVTNEGMFAMEKDAQMRRQNTVGDETLAFARGEGHLGDGRGPKDHMQFAEINGRKIVYRRTGKDDFLIGGQQNQSNLRCSSYSPDVNEFEGTTKNLNRTFSHETDESFIVPFRTMSLDQVGNDKRTAIDVDPEFPSKLQDSKNKSNQLGNQVNYEPDALSFIPERGSDKRSTVYDPALDYDLRFCVKGTSLDRRNKKVVTDVNQGSKNSDKDRRSKGIPDKKIGGPIRRGNSSKMSPLDEARARAERLRTYKSELQKMKKEKEEAEQKRLNALKLERQKRIAARGRTASSQSPMPSLQTRKSLPAKFSPISHHGSKFSDIEPGSSSPLQRSKLRTASLGSIDLQKASKVSKSSDASHLKGNRLSRSVSSFSEPKKERNGVTPDSKVSKARVRRLSEPKTSNGSSTSVKMRSAEQVPKPKVFDGPVVKKISTIRNMDQSKAATSVKMRNAEQVPKPKVFDGPMVKKISTIRNMDQSKAATLPELKIKTSKRASSVGQNKSAAKEMKNNDKRSNQSDADKNPIVDKTVVMLEYEKPSDPTNRPSEGKMGITKGHKGTFNTGEKIEVVSEYVAVPALPSPMDGVDTEPIPRRVQARPSSHEVMTSHTEKETPKFSSINNAEKPHQAPKTNLEMAPTDVGTNKAHVSGLKNLKLERIPEALEKPPVKEPSKGFKRLLKLGRKNHMSAEREQSGKPDNASVNGSEFGDNATNYATSSEVHTLKNLISQEEVPTSGNTPPQKSSRHFSLLSPFRSKSSEKKLIT